MATSGGKLNVTKIIKCLIKRNTNFFKIVSYNEKRGYIIVVYTNLISKVKYNRYNMHK